MLENKIKFSARSLPFLCLLAAAVLELLLIVGVPQSRPGIWAEEYLIVPCAMFLGVALTKPLSKAAKKCLILGGILSAWLLAAQNLQLLAGEGFQNISAHWAGYLLALPFACVMEDGREEKGLDTVASVLIAGSALLSLYAVLAWMGMVPSIMASGVLWNGARRASGWNPDIIGLIYLMGMALGIRRAFRCRKGWAKAGFWLLAGVQFLALSAAGSRLMAVLACVFLGGVVFFCNQKKTWGRITAYLLVGLLLAGSLFVVSQAVSNGYSEPPASVETENISSEPEDMQSIIGRAYAWKAALTTVRYHGDIRLRGTTDVKNAIAIGGYEHAEHAYNSWLQMALSFGVPSLLIALYFTWIAVRDAVLLLFFRDCGIERKCTVLLVLCLLAAGMLEPILFTGEIRYQYFNVLFFLCLGYMEQWLAQK